MKRQRVARTVLATDGAGCAAAVALVLGSDEIVRSIDPSLKARWPAAAALAATSTLLAVGAMREEPRNRDLERAAGVNLGWVAICLAGLMRHQSPSGAVIFASTAVLDGAAATAQLALRSPVPKNRRGARE